MIKPNYQNGSIVNLMASIKNALGGKSLYQPLKDFEISQSQNIILVIIDGLGYDYLLKYGKDSFLYKNLKRKMTSVFPATTAAAITTYFTGLPPQQHALTGWYMYLKEIGALSLILPFTTRTGNLSLHQGNVNYQDIYNQKTIFENIPVTSYSVKDKAYIHSDYSRLVDKGANQLPFSNLNGFFRQIHKALTTSQDKKYILAYWAKFDYLCHKYGTESLETKKHFDELDRKIKLLAKSLVNKNTTLIVSADHGLIDVSKEKIIDLKDHPKFTETLAIPLSGEPRAVYCYVRPAKVKQFKKYVATNFKKYCRLFKSEDLIKRNLFGLFEPNPKLQDRIGDYVLIMKKDYVIKDQVLGEIQHANIGRHGGMSHQEMFVPLIIIE
ncbi:MAG: alkaline phosphatase family protein [Candidatus Shapirobacteria bacterium]|jgi:predicted AlkP superfamily pyrophosphatase or phosphodiesterase